MYINELMEREDFASLSALEIQYLMTDDEHKEAFALGVTWTIMSYTKDKVSVDELEVWAERANCNLIMDGDEVVGLTDACPE